MFVLATVSDVWRWKKNEMIIVVTTGYFVV